MPNPADVQPSNFKVHEIIYDFNGFSVAWGTWEDGSVRLGMRWNGEGEDQGYPKSFGYPMWFMLPSELVLPISQAIRSGSATLPPATPVA